MVTRTLACSLFLIAVAGACLGACGAGQEVAFDEEAAEAVVPNVQQGGPLRAAILLRGNPDDDGWSRAGQEGMQVIGDALGADTAISKNVEVSDAVQVMRDYAGRGYQLVIAQGSEYEGAALRVADEYPGTQFAVIDGSVGNDTNVAIANVDSQQIGYVTGFVAGKMSRSGIIALVAHQEGTARMTRTVAAWRMGADAASPGIQTCVRYVENSDDVAEARARAGELAEKGADVFYSELYGGSQGVVDVVLDAGIWVTARDAGRIERAADLVLLRVDYRYDMLYERVAAAYVAGDLGGSRISVGLGSNPPGFEVDFTENVPEDIVDEVNGEVVPFLTDDAPASFFDVPAQMGARGCQGG